MLAVEGKTHHLHPIHNPGRQIQELGSQLAATASNNKLRHHVGDLNTSIHSQLHHHASDLNAITHAAHTSIRDLGSHLHAPDLHAPHVHIGKKYRQAILQFSFCTHGRHRKVSLDRMDQHFFVFVDGDFAAESTCIEYRQLHIPFQISIEGKDPLQAVISHQTSPKGSLPVEPWQTSNNQDGPTLTVNSVPVPHWWSLEDGANLKRPMPEVADIGSNRKLPEMSGMDQPHLLAEIPKDVVDGASLVTEQTQIPVFVHPRMLEAPKSWWACCTLGPPEGRPKTVFNTLHMPHDRETCACCRSDGHLERPSIDQVCKVHCSNWGREMFEE